MGPCVAIGLFCNLFGWPLGHDVPAQLSALRSQIDDPVRALDHVQMVLDDDDGVPVPPEAEEDLD